MQEEVENKTVNLAISTTKLTARTVVKAFNLWRGHHQKVSAKNAAKKAAKKAEIPTGKQSIQELIGQNQGVTNIDIAKTDLKGFERVARKYGVDYAITKDKHAVPPKYMVFFKARDADALTAAFEEFSNAKLKVQDRPSVLKQLKKLKEMVAAITPDKVRHKSKELDL